MRTGLISTPEGPAFIRCVGKGPRVVVFHGGPGFDHRYLVEPLRFLAPRRKLVFYDQPGCGSTPRPEGGATPEHTFRHAHAVLQAVSAGDPVGVIAHSWGAVVLAGALARDNAATRARAFSEGLLINPTAINRSDYEVARKNFAVRIPLARKLRILLASLSGSNGARIMDLLMPYYSGNTPAYPPGIIPLDLATYRSINRGLAGFDFSDSLSRLRRLLILRGENDFTSPAEIGELIAATAGLETIPGAGHFPFIETSAAFREAARRAFVETRTGAD